MIIARCLSDRVAVGPKVVPRREHVRDSTLLLDVRGGPAPIGCACEHGWNQPERNGVYSFRDGGYSLVLTLLLFN